MYNTFLCFYIIKCDTNWVWRAGSTLVNQPAVYGTKGIAAPTNVPGARYSSVSWTDSNDNLWLFGGSRNTFQNINSQRVDI